MIPKVTVPYEHRENATGRIDLAVVRRGTKPNEDDWQPALRDTIDGTRVVWVRSEPTSRGTEVWLRDSSGTRRVRAV